MLRMDAVRARTGHSSKTSIRDAVLAGELTKPVAIGVRRVGWPDYEIELIVAAQVAGLTVQEIRQLVQQLHAHRIERFKAMMPMLEQDEVLC